MNLTTVQCHAEFWGNRMKPDSSSAQKRLSGTGVSRIHSISTGSAGAGGRRKGQRDPPPEDPHGKSNAS